MKWFVVGFISLWMTACGAQDENYYRLNPNELTKALQKCPTSPPKKISCEQLEKYALQLNALVWELRSNPQEYGKKILQLQQDIALQEQELSRHSDEGQLQIKLNQNKQILNQHLAIVKWLEAPES